MARKPTAARAALVRTAHGPGGVHDSNRVCAPVTTYRLLLSLFYKGGTPRMTAPPPERPWDGRRASSRRGLSVGGGRRCAVRERPVLVQDGDKPLRRGSAIASSDAGGRARASWKANRGGCRRPLPAPRESEGVRSRPSRRRKEGNSPQPRVRHACYGSVEQSRGALSISLASSSLNSIKDVDEQTIALSERPESRNPTIEQYLLLHVT